MARPSKIQRFAENQASSNVISVEKPIFEEIAGNWQSNFFKNERPITLELACGRGEYTIGLGQQFQNRKFVGIDLKGDRIWVGSQQAQTLGLENVAFIRARIELLPQFFAPNEVDEIWLTFPDPRPKDRDEKHRVTNIFYLNLYRSILRKDGWFRFKTDNTKLFEYTLDVLKGMKLSELDYTMDLYDSAMLSDHHGLSTKYEKIWTGKGELIKYLRCKFE